MPAELRTEAGKGCIYSAIWSQNLIRSVFHSHSSPNCGFKKEYQMLIWTPEKNVSSWQCWVAWEAALRLKGMADLLRSGGIQKAIKFFYGACQLKE